MKTIAVFLLFILLLSDLTAQEEKKSDSVDKEPIYQPKRLLPKDRIPAIFKPTFKTASESTISKKAPVIGVEIEGEAHCYSIYLLNRHEIVNDEIKGHPFAVTW